MSVSCTCTLQSINKIKRNNFMYCTSNGDVWSGSHLSLTGRYTPDDKSDLSNKASCLYFISCSYNNCQSLQWWVPKLNIEG